MKKLIKKIRDLLTLDGYAVAPLFQQIIILISISITFIFLMSILLGSLKDSYSLFFNPDALIRQNELPNVLLGIFTVVIGVILGGFIISILSTSLINFINTLKSGVTPYKKSGHIVFINKNKRLFQILNDIDQKINKLKVTQDILILLPDKNDVAPLLSDLQLKCYQNLCINVKTGDPLTKETYNRINASHCFGIAILLDDSIEDVFFADNRNIQVLSAILSDNDTANSISEGLKILIPKKCIIEVNDLQFTTSLINNLLVLYDVPGSFVPVNSDYYISLVTSRSVADMGYYKIFNEVISHQGKEIYFVDPGTIRSDKKSQLIGMNFKDACIAIDNGILIGISRSIRGELTPILAPFEDTIVKGDWLLIITERQSEIHFNSELSCFLDHSGERDLNIRLNQPSELVNKKVCMIGEKLNLQRVLDFITPEFSKYFIKYKKENYKEYFNEEFLNEICRLEYDSVILNLEDDICYKLAIYILSKYGLDSSFYKSLILIIDDPRIENLVKSATKQEQVILSNKILGLCYTQILFQKNIYKIIDELSVPEGHEMHLVDIPLKEISPDCDKSSIKKMFLDNKMLYIGVEDYHGNILIDENKFNKVKRFIILAEGDITD